MINVYLRNENKIWNTWTVFLVRLGCAGEGSPTRGPGAERGSPTSAAVPWSFDHFFFLLN